MQFNNSKQLFLIRLKQFIITLAGALFIIIMLFVNGIPEGSEWKTYGIAYLAVIIIVAIYHLIVYKKNYYFIYFNDLPDRFLIRYYSNRILTQKKNAIEIPKSEFVGFSIYSAGIGIEKYLSVMQKTQRGIARYPKISISALNKTQIERLKSALNKETKQS